MQLTLTLLLATASPHPAGPSGPAELPDEAISLDLAPLEPLDPRMRTELSEHLHARAAAVIARHPVSASRVHVAIGWHDVDAFDYDITLDIDGCGGTAARRDRRSTGADTEQSELGDVVEAVLERELGACERDRARADAAVSAVRPPPPPSARRSPRLGAVGWAGVGLAVAGAGGVGAGIALLSLQPTAHPTDETKLRTWQPGGAALVTIGGVALVTGTVLAVIDGRRRATKGRPSVAAWGGHRGAGVVLRVAF